MLLQCSFLTDTDCIIHAYQYSSNIILFIIDLSLVILRLLWRQKTGSGREGTRGRNGDRCGNGLGGKKKETGFHFTTTPTSDRHYLSVSHPFLSSTIHTHSICPLVHLLPKLHQMSHPESLGTELQPDEEFVKFSKIFVERLRIEVAEAWRGGG